MIVFNAGTAMVIGTFCSEPFIDVVYGGTNLMIMDTLIQGIAYGVIVLFIVVVVSGTTKLRILYGIRK